MTAAIDYDEYECERGHTSAVQKNAKPLKRCPLAPCSRPVHRVGLGSRTKAGAK